MDAIIRLHLSELTEKSILKIKDIFTSATDKNDPELTISLSIDSVDSEYFDRLNQSIRQYSEGNFVSFTMEQLETYINEEAGK